MVIDWSRTNGGINILFYRKENPQLIEAMNDAVMLISRQDLPQSRTAPTIEALLNHVNNTLIPNIKSLIVKNNEKGKFV